MAARRRIGTRGWGRGRRRGVGGRCGWVFWGALGHDKGQRTARHYGYEGRINDGGTFVSVDASEGEIAAERVREIMTSNSGHSANQPSLASANLS